jgi:zinc-binding alcohol dehydrogenase/oxidoreductase
VKAVVYHSNFPEKVALVTVDKPQPEINQCLVKIMATALNRRDQWIREGLYPGIKDDVVLGSDACGEVVEGPPKWLGKRVLINPNINWGTNPQVQSAKYSILGMPVNGTFSEYLTIATDRLMEAPSHLSNQEAAALPLGGLTAFRALFTKGEMSSGQKVLVTGVGGGVAQFALQLAVAGEALVYVTSSQDEKINKAIVAGALGGFNYRSDHWTKEAQKVDGFDLVIDSAGGEEVNNYLKIIKPGGKIVMYGSTLGRTPKLDTARLFWSQVSLIGSTMGNDDEFKSMIDYVARTGIRPTIDAVYPISEYLAAFNRFEAEDHYGKIVMTF